MNQNQEYKICDSELENNWDPHEYDELPLYYMRDKVNKTQAHRLCLPGAIYHNDIKERKDKTKDKKKIAMCPKHQHRILNK